MSNRYDTKIKIAGKSVQIKKYDFEQVRVKEGLGSRFEVIKEDDVYIFDNHTGEIFENLEEFKSKNFKATEKLYTSIKFKYHKLTEIQRFLVNKEKNIRRSRERIQDLINANIPYQDLKQLKFLTLTFKENVTDVRVANAEFKEFIKRLNKYYFRIERCKYVAILENQDRGAIHYHLILFNSPYMEWERLKELWGLGFIDIESVLFNKKKQKVKVDDKGFIIGQENIENIGAYLSKTIDYVTKDISEILEKIKDQDLTDEEIEELIKNSKNQVIWEKDVKIYQASRGNLEKAKIIYTDFQEFKEIYDLLKLYYKKWLDKTLIISSAIITFNDIDMVEVMGSITVDNFILTDNSKVFNDYVNKKISEEEKNGKS